MHKTPLTRSKEYAKLEWFDSEHKRGGGMIFMEDVSVEYMLERIKVYTDGLRVRGIDTILIRWENENGYRIEKYDNKGTLLFRGEHSFVETEWIRNADKPDTGKCVEIF